MLSAVSATAEERNSPVEQESSEIAKAVGNKDNELFSNLGKDLIPFSHSGLLFAQNQHNIQCHFHRWNGEFI